MSEYKTRMTFICKLSNKIALQIKLAIESMYVENSVPTMKLTSDNGFEFTNH